MLNLDFKGEIYCSQRDPFKEATQWLDLQKVTNNHFWILGLGAGYHVAAMVNRYPNHVITVVDHRADLKTQFEENFPQCRHHVRIEIVESDVQLMDSQSFRLFGPNMSSVHRFRPAICRDQEQYAGFSKVLRGQTRESFLFFCQYFEIPMNAISLTAISDFQIKEISTAVESQGHSEARKWVRVLRELVA